MMLFSPIKKRVWHEKMEASMDSSFSLKGRASTGSLTREHCCLVRNNWPAVCLITPGELCFWHLCRVTALLVPISDLSPFAPLASTWVHLSLSPPLLQVHYHVWLQRVPRKATAEDERPVTKLHGEDGWRGLPARQPAALFQFVVL